MTIKRLLSPCLLAAAITAVCAAPAHAVWFAAENVDGPNGDVGEIGGADLSRDGGGGVTFLKRDGTVNHVYVAQFYDGKFFPAQRVDTGQAFASSQPRVAAGEDGRLAVVWINAGSLYGVVQADKNGSFSAPARIFEGSAAGPVADPSFDMSVHGVGYVAFTAPGGGRDVRAARLGAGGSSWTTINGSFDNVAGNDAGTGRGAPSVSVSADGSALVGWGEAGGTLIRRAGRTAVSGTVISASDADLLGATPGGADEIEVGLGNDSSYGYVVTRQTFTADGNSASRLIARRLIGSSLNPPQPIDGLDFPAPEGASRPRLAIDGRGRGIAVGSRDSSRTPIAALGRDDGFAGGQLLSQLTNGGTPPDTEVGVGEALDGVVAWKEAPPDAPAGTVVKARFETDNSYGDEFQVSRDDFGPTNVDRGMYVASDDQANSIVVFVQGGPDGRRVVAGVYDKPPGRARGLTKTVVTSQEPRFRWSEANEQFGPVKYTVILDGEVIGETDGALSLAAPRPISIGRHRWRVDVEDSRGQKRKGNLRNLRVDSPSAPAGTAGR